MVKFVEIYARSGDWQAVALTTRSDQIDLPELRFRCSVEDLYRGTPLVAPSK